MSKRTAVSLLCVLGLSVLGCKEQRQPSAPPPPPKPTTSSAPAPARAGTVSVEDAVITGKVRAAVLNTEEVKATQIDVETRNGVVHLSGVVQTNADRDRAVHLARQVEGVKDVQAALKVQSS